MVAITDEHLAVTSRQPEQRRSKFSWSLLGYRRRAVDHHVAELEREINELDTELIELRAAATLREEVAAEMRRIGAETAGVLIEAQHQRDSIVRAAEEEARRLIGDATARVQQLEMQREAIHQERDRLLHNAFAASTAIADAVRAAHHEVPALGASETAPTAAQLDESR